MANSPVDPDDLDRVMAELDRLGNVEDPDLTASRHGRGQHHAYR